MSGKLHSLGASFAYLLVVAGSSLAALVLLTLLGMGESQTDVSILAGLLTAVIAVLLLRRRDPDFYKALPSRSWVLRAVALSAAVTCLVQCIPYFVPAQLQESLQGKGFHRQPLADLVGTVLISPVAEELVFRGLILDELRGAFPTWGAVVLSGALFGLMHGHVVWGLMAFCMAILYSWLGLRSKSIYLPVAAHITSNLLAYFVNYIPGV